jgi:F-type H+-transporting ATPase subunit delta
MALTRSTARRYAEAAFEIADRDGTIDAWLAGLKVAEERLGDPEVERFLINPAVPFLTRREVVEKLLGDDVQGAPRNLVLLLLQRSRVQLLPAVARELRRLHARREGIIEAEVTSAAVLSDPELDAIRQRLIQMTGGRVEISLRIDPEILGGVQVRIGDRLIDGSVRGRLERLRSRLASGSI